MLLHLAVSRLYICDFEACISCASEFCVISRVLCKYSRTTGTSIYAQYQKNSRKIKISDISSLKWLVARIPRSKSPADP